MNALDWIVALALFVGLCWAIIRTQRRVRARRAALDKIRY